MTMKAGEHPMFTLELARAQIRELHRTAEESRRGHLPVERRPRRRDRAR